jgi:hypothetical protein
LNGGVSGNNSAGRFLCPKQDRILQDRKIPLHYREADRFDDFTRSKAVGLAVSDLQTIGFILQKNGR